MSEETLAWFVGVASASCVLTGAITLYILRKTFFIALVVGDSMLPTFQNGDELLCIRKLRRVKPSINSLVIFNNTEVDTSVKGYSTPIQYSVKRVVAVGESTFELPTKELPKGVREIYENRLERNKIIWNIPKGFCFVKGDNRTTYHTPNLFSIDSTITGPIPISSIVGSVLFKLSSSTPPSNSRYS